MLRRLICAFGLHRFELVAGTTYKRCTRCRILDLRQEIPNA